MKADVTEALRFAFQKSGLGRDSFRHITDLEAKVFMRADRRVLIDFG